ncbi:MAG: hypothetical protein JWQ62_521 [Lacunisphaera sp.]|nr:hypothetical protein [Lacunisphaera sp.]
MNLMFSRSLRIAVLLAAWSALSLPGAEPVKTTPEEALELPKLAIKGSPISSYGFGISALRDPVTKKIKRLIVADVTEDSEAQRRGIQEGDEILSINGTKVAGMDGLMKPGFLLFDLLVNQPAGQSIKFEIAVRVPKTFTLTSRL